MTDYSNMSQSEIIRHAYDLEESLVAARRQLRTVVHNAPVVVFTVDKDGLFTLPEGRGASSLGLDRVQVSGESVFELFKSHPKVLENIRSCLRGETVVDTVSIGGAWYDNWYSPIRENDDVIGLIGVAIDVSAREDALTDRENLEGQIRHGQRLESLGVLAGGVGDDLGSLMDAIMTSVDDAATGDKAVDECLAAIRKSAARAAELCGQMLSYTGHGQLDVGPVDLREVVQGVTSLIELCMPEKAEFVLDFDDQLPRILADESQMRQLVMNLVTNAAEALEDAAGTVSLLIRAIPHETSVLKQSYMQSSLEAGDYVEVSVADTGCGMDDATRALIFDPFFSTKATGRGLGMAAVMGIVRGHQGAIRIDSAPGSGTTCAIWLPSEDTAPRPTPAARGPGGLWQGEGRVLLVDDEIPVLDTAGKMLEKMGLDVVVASSGQKAIDLFREQDARIDCIILDMSMPGMDGREVLQGIRQIRTDVRVLISSGYDEDDVTEGIAPADLAGFIQKPYQIETLAEIMQGIFTRRS